MHPSPPPHQAWPPPGAIPPPTWPAPAPRVRRPVPGGVVVGVLVTVFVVVTAAALVAGRPPRQVPRSGAEVYLAADGARQILTGPRSTQVRWTGHQPGTRPFTDGPVSFVRAVIDDPRRQDTAWVVENEDDSEGTHPHLMALDRDGVRTRATTWPQEWAFTPGRLEIPANPRAGQREITAGMARNAAGEAAYTSTLEVLDASSVGARCLEFRRTDRIGREPETTSSRTRCPNRGAVSLTLPVTADGDAPVPVTWTETPDWPAGLAPGDSVDLSEIPTGAPLTGLRAEPLTFLRGGIKTPLATAGAPQLIDDRLVLVTQQTGNIVWTEPLADPGTFGPGRWVTVGGDVITSARCGEVMAVATTNRQVVAHNGTGTWLWTAEFDDVAGSAPVRSGDQLLVATKDGGLHAVSCRDGSVAWTAGPVVSVRPPAVGPAGVLVATEGGVMLLDPVTGATRWQRSVPDAVSALAQLGELALVGTTENQLFVFEAGSGELRAFVRVPDAIREMYRLGDVTVARTNSRVVGIDADWRVSWTVPVAGIASLADENQILIANPQEVVALDSTGAVVERRELPLDIRSSRIYLTRTPDGYLAGDSGGNLARWRS